MIKNIHNCVLYSKFLDSCSKNAFKYYLQTKRDKKTVHNTVLDIILLKYLSDFNQEYDTDMEDS